MPLERSPCFAGPGWLPGPHQPPPHLLPIRAPGWQGRSPQHRFDALDQIFGHHPASYPLAGKQEAPSQPIPLGRFLMQQPPALAAFLKAHQAPLIGAGMEGDAPADPALEHIVKNLDLGHGHNGEGPDPKAAPRKGWPGSGVAAPKGELILVAASLRSPCASAAAWEGPAAN